MPQTESFICLEAEANESEGKSDGVQGSEGKRNINLAIAEASILSKAQRSKHIFITSFCLYHSGLGKHFVELQYL